MKLLDIYLSQMLGQQPRNFKSFVIQFEADFYFTSRSFFDGSFPFLLVLSVPSFNSVLVMFFELDIAFDKILIRGDRILN